MTEQWLSSVSRQDPGTLISNPSSTLEKFTIPAKIFIKEDIIRLTYIMSLSTLHGNFKLQDAECGNVHKQLAIMFVPEEESTVELDKVEITLRVSLNATGGDTTNNVMKNRIARFKMGNLEELINWRVWLNCFIWNKLCKTLESHFDMLEMLLGGKVLQHWQQFMFQVTGLPILGVLDENKESSNEEEENNKAEKKKELGQSSTSATSPAGLMQDTYKS
eukprot:15327735-Ditylum_brightwellii.AAC.1